MILKLTDSELELKFTFNSFKYMEEFDISKLDGIENRPFKIIGVTRELLIGGLNHSPAKLFNEVDADVILEEVIENGSVGELLELLLDELQESNFFKSLQKTSTPKRKKK